MCQGSKQNVSRQDVMAYLVAMIRDRKFKIDEKIYSENFIANKLGVSRSLVHEVYTALEHMGIVECVHGEGTYLKKIDNLDLDSPLCLLMFLVSEDSYKILEFRRIIEVGIVKKVIEEIKDSDIKRMYKALDIIKVTNDYMEASENDILIHSIFANSVENPLITFTYNMAVVYLTYISNDNWQRILCDNSGRMKEIQIRQHLDIVKALENRSEEDCMNAVLTHLSYIETKLLQLKY